MLSEKVDELLTKLPKVFKRDAYIINHTYIVGGDESEKINPGFSMCILTKKYIDALDEMYPDSKNIFISDIRKSKKEPLEYIHTTFDNNEFEIAKKNMASIEKTINKFNDWKSLKIYDSDGSSFFDDAYIKHIPGETDTVVVSKEMFPLVSKTLSPTVSYNIKEMKDDDLCILGIIIDLPYFQIQSTYKYVIV